MTIRHYRGSCQCGAVSYEVDIDLDNAITCNCSRCRRLGSVLAFTPRANFDLKSGAESLTEYQFNRNQISHLFCKICGIQSFAYGAMPDGSPVAAVNANCLDDVDARAIPAQAVDGRSF